MLDLMLGYLLKAHVNGHYGFRRELPACPRAVRSPSAVIRWYAAPGLAFGRGDA